MADKSRKRRGEEPEKKKGQPAPKQAKAAAEGVSEQDEEEDDNNSDGRGFLDGGDDDDDDDDDEDVDEEEIIEDDNDDDYDSEGGAAVVAAAGADKKKKQRETVQPEIKTFLPGDAIDEDDELVYDPSAYVVYLKEFMLEWPCLSFDVVRDNLGDNRTQFPMSIQLVAGTQAEKPADNRITIVKLSNINKVKHKENESDDDSDISDDDSEDGGGSTSVAKFSSRSIAHHAGINRVRVAPQEGCVVACCDDQGSIVMHDMSALQRQLDDSSHSKMPLQTKPLFQCSHRSEGFALDWSRVTPFRLVAGDVDGAVRIWDKHEGSTWKMSELSRSHDCSVEDLQWSPNEANVLASCSADQSIRIWDARKAKAAISLHAHDSDVNVISWNKIEQHLLVSGGDDGLFKVWDMRMFRSKAPEPIAKIKWHKGPITSVQWHHTDASVIGVAGADNQVTLWDLAVEADQETLESRKEADVPPQLLFIHQGQKEIKEIHWHPQIPGLMLSTAEAGFNVFRSISV
jgi:ribosome assembly protein RRB1